MIDQAKVIVEAALAAGADYADARVSRLHTEDLALRNGELAEAQDHEDFGLGLRILKDGTWGFIATPLPEELGLEDARRIGQKAARKAMRVTKGLGRLRSEPVKLCAEPAHVSSYSTPVEVDPFQVSLAEKIEFLSEASSSMEGADETVVREATLSVRGREQWLVTSEGSEIHQALLRTGAGVSTTAAANGNVERRSFPASFGGLYKTGGWEVVRDLGLAERGERLRDESVELCHADACPEGPRTVIIGGSQLMLQIHESVGHPTELDRVLGHEVDLAGGSFADTEKLGSFEYGSEHVTLMADSTLPGGLDTRGFDDEGVASGAWPIVDRGRFTGYLTGREWASAIGEERSRGAMRAESWYDPPIVRITNLSLLPGTWGFDELVADTEDGAVFCDTVRMWSIDQRRLNFQFTCEYGREVKDGKLGRLLRRPTYQGTTPEFWRSCDAVCGPAHWEAWGVPNCGKGNPMQVAEMSHGAAPARFRSVSFVQ